MLLLPLIAAICSLTINKPSNYEWAKCGPYDRLISRDDGPGVGLDSTDHNRKVTLLDGAGRVQEVIQVSDKRTPLSYFNEQLVTTGPILTTSKGGLVPYVDPWVISSGGFFFLLSGGITFLNTGGIPEHSFPKFDGSSAIGINRKLNLLVWLTGWGGAWLTCSNYLEMIDQHRRPRWIDDPNPTELGVRGVGFCELLPGLNDIAFISNDVFAFIGKTSSDRDEAEFGRWKKGLIDLSAEGFSTKPNEKCELFATDARTLETVGFAIFNHRSDPEGVGFGLGNMMSSFDEKFLFIQAGGKVLRIPSADILAKFRTKTF